MEGTKNQIYLYCIYEMVKRKIQWFGSVEQLVMSAMQDHLETDLMYKTKLLIGKIYGLMMKNNMGIIEQICELEN